ncbi:molybdate ABC transporter permease subunit [Ancylobacter defluvii]|uniref:Molybdenum transport system permease n=1 Tax=Ancylobacter defluvii TaxID=1282440 RepID=A0A9W6K0X5_9HYPH|nr:molybdate ABC transporter permease subunit [Ancylobacter defluvii]MBS7588357.1 molybdate ABC transporter permease subunit [Ancylobacter defluvii]GLK86762.1 molybdate ABC transporter permease [Ancylobacter defluvii]
MLTPEEWTAVYLSLKVAFWATFWSLPFALATAFVLARLDFPGKSLFDGIVYLPLVLPKVVVGYLLLITLGARGYLGQYLAEWFNIRLIFTTAGAIVAAAVISFPLTVNAIRLALEAVDRGLETAARTLGANRLDVFLTITLPLMLPGILSGALLAVASALGEFGATITFVSNVEGQTRTIPLAIYSATHMPDGDAMALRLTVVSIVLALASLLLAGLADRRIRTLIGRA